MLISRRRVIACLVALGIVLFGAMLAASVAAVADSERISSYWVGGVLTDSGLQVTEVIDYDFGPVQRHGIFRDIPDVLVDTIRVSSPTAPAATAITEGFVDTNIRIGDPDQTISGRHRYQIGYMLPLEAVVHDGEFAWDAVGTGFTVAIADIELELAGVGDLATSRCSAGTSWAEGSCSFSRDLDGRWTASIDSLGAGQGATLSGRLGTPSVDTPSIIAPSGPAIDPGSGIVPPAVVTLLFGAIGAIGATFLARRAGWDRVWDGGAVDAAFGQQSDGTSSSRMSESDLAQLATIEFEPPRDMSAVEGGILMEEQVLGHHMSAWLLESAMRHEIELDGDTTPVLRRGSAPSHPSVHPILDAMFGTRTEFELDGYDARFAKGWTRLKGDLDDWFHGSAHWDTEGRRRQKLANWFGTAGVLAGLATMLLGAGFANRSGESWLILVAMGAAVFGASNATALSSFELLARTEHGSALWLRVESFRRFLAASEARHVNDAAERGVLRQYTAWAVALGESDAWTKAVHANEAVNPAFASTHRRDLLFVGVGSRIFDASSVASVTPGSSGGGFSGSAGGGGGGGGGGSW